MIEPETILRRLTVLEEYCNDLDEARQAVNWENFSHDKVVRRYVERTLHNYIRVQPEIVYAILQKNLSDILEFANIIKERFLGNQTL